MVSKSPHRFSITPSHLRRMASLWFQDKITIILGGVCCLLFIIVTVLCIPIYILRIFVILLAKLFRPDLGDILNGLSSYFVNDYFYNNKYPRGSIIVSVVIYGQDLSIQELRDLLLERWIRAKDNTTGKFKFEQFHQYPVRWLGFTFWKNCMHTFSIDNHVLLEEQMDAEGVNDEEMNNICEKILNAPYPPKRSPWEVHLVKNYKSDQLSIPHNNRGDETTYVILFKVHHCLADGFSMLNALVQGLGQHSLTKANLHVPTFPKRNFWEGITYYITFPFSAFYEISYGLSHIFRSSRWKVPDNKKEWYQFCAKSDFIPIQNVKFIKNQLKVSFTSVLLSAISSAFSQCKDKKNLKNLCIEPEEDDRSVFCMSPLPLPNHSKRLTNQSTYAFFDLLIQKYGSSMDRLHEVDNMLELTKNTCIPAITPLYISAIGCNFYFVGKLIGRQRMLATGLSNFPSVPIKIEQDGRKCVAADFLAGGLDVVVGVGIMVLSYAEYIRVAVTAEKAVMSKDEVNRFVENVIDEIDQLYMYCCTQP